MKYMDKRKVFWGIIFLFVSLPSMVEAETFIPDWNLGDKWIVKAIYSSPIKKGDWSKPIYWIYKINGHTFDDGEETYSIEIMPKEKGEIGIHTDILCRASDLVPIKIKIEDSGGRKKKQIVRYSGLFPIRTEHTITPHDMPVFPVVTSGGIQKYETKKKISQDLYSVDSIYQKAEIVSYDSVDELSSSQGEGSVIKISCSLNDGKLYFVQYWDRKYPWPVYGENQNMKYWLVK